MIKPQEEILETLKREMKKNSRPLQFDQLSSGVRVALADLCRILDKRLGGTK